MHWFPLPFGIGGLKDEHRAKHELILIWFPKWQGFFPLGHHPKLQKISVTKSLKGKWQPVMPQTTEVKGMASRPIVVPLEGCIYQRMV
eukprot:Skav208404  [mRNA]  locus=scaffold1179:286746:287129:+ [translate_table: standard]